MCLDEDEVVITSHSNRRIDRQQHNHKKWGTNKISRYYGAKCESSVGIDAESLCQDELVVCDS